MAEDQRTIRVRVVGDDVSASRAIRNVGTAAKLAEKDVGSGTAGMRGQFSTLEGHLQRVGSGNSIRNIGSSCRLAERDVAAGTTGMRGQFSALQGHLSNAGAGGAHLRNIGSSCRLAERDVASGTTGMRSHFSTVQSQMAGVGASGNHVRGIGTSTRLTERDVASGAAGIRGHFSTVQGQMAGVGASGNHVRGIGTATKQTERDVASGALGMRGHFSTVQGQMAGVGASGNHVRNIGSCMKFSERDVASGALGMRGHFSTVQSHMTNLGNGSSQIRKVGTEVQTAEKHTATGTARMRGHFDSLHSTIGKLGGGVKGLLSNFAGLGSAALVGGGIVAIGKFFGSCIKDAEQAQAKIRLTETVIKSTGGAAGISSGQITKLATSLSMTTGATAGTVREAANLLLTFTNIRGEVYQRAMPAVMDMAAAFHIGPTQAAKVLGKALNDPIQGMTALQRVGVQLTDAQKEQIKQFVASGNVAAAQGIILDEVGKKSKGAAEAMATPAQKANAAWASFRAMVGGVLLPAWNALMQGIANGLRLIVSGFQGTLGHISGFGWALASIGIVLRGFVVGIRETFQFLGKFREILVPIAGAVGGAAVAFGIWKAAMLAHMVVTKLSIALQMAWNAVLMANPIMLIIVAIGALVGVLIYCYNHFKWFHNGVNAALHGLVIAFNWLKDGVVVAFNWIKNIIVDWVWPILKVLFYLTLPGAILWVITHWQMLRDWVVNVWTHIKNFIVDHVWPILRILFYFTLPGAILWMVQHWQTLRDWVVNIWTHIKNFVVDHIWPILQYVLLITGPGAILFLITHWRQLWDWVFNIWTHIKNFIVDHIWPILQYVLLITAPGAILFLITHWKMLRDWIVNLWTHIVNALIAGWNWMWAHVFVPIARICVATWQSFGAMRDTIIQVWNSLVNGIQAGWDWIRDHIFNPIADFITRAIPNAWREGCDAIGRWWDGLREKTKAPINWVIDVVINKGIIGTVNKVSDWLHVPLNLKPIGLLAAGGMIPGTPSDVDDRLALLDGRGLIGVASGEFIVNARQAQKNRPILEAINSGDGYAAGGPVGRVPGMAIGGWFAGLWKKISGGDGGFDLGSIAGMVTGTGKELFEVLSDPLKWFTDHTPIGEIIKRYGESAYAKTLTGVPKILIEKVVDWFKKTVEELGDRLLELLGLGGDFFGGVGIPSWQAIINLAKTSKIPFGVSSTARPGSTSTSGARDYHSTGNAVDFVGPAMAQLAKWFYDRVAAFMLELIHSGGGGFFVKNGRRVPASFYGAEVGGHFDHVHVAMTNNGVRAAMGGGGGAGAWSGLIVQALAMLGLPASWLPFALTLISRESGGNPNAVSSAGAIGLMQVMPGTFAAYHRPGFDNPRDPLSNLLAGLWYIKNRYKDITRVQQARADYPKAPGGYRLGGAVFDEGGWLNEGWNAVYNGTGAPEELRPARGSGITVIIEDGAVRVTGSVIAERDLADAIATAVRDKLNRVAYANGGDNGLRTERGLR